MEAGLHTETYGFPLQPVPESFRGGAGMTSQEGPKEERRSVTKSHTTRIMGPAVVLSRSSVTATHGRGDDGGAVPSGFTPCRIMRIGPTSNTPLERLEEKNPNSMSQ